MTQEKQEKPKNLDGVWVNGVDPKYARENSQGSSTANLNMELLGKVYFEGREYPIYCTIFSGRCVISKDHFKLLNRINEYFLNNTNTLNSIISELEKATPLSTRGGPVSPIKEGLVEIIEKILEESSKVSSSIMVSLKNVEGIYYSDEAKIKIYHEKRVSREGKVLEEEFLEVYDIIKDKPAKVTDKQEVEKFLLNNLRKNIKKFIEVEVPCKKKLEEYKQFVENKKRITAYNGPIGCSEKSL